MGFAHAPWRQLATRYCFSLSGRKSLSKVGPTVGIIMFPRLHVTMGHRFCSNLSHCGFGISKKRLHSLTSLERFDARTHDAMNWMMMSWAMPMAAATWRVRRYSVRVTLRRGDFDGRGWLLWFNKTNNFNTEFVLTTPPTQSECRLFILPYLSIGGSREGPKGTCSPPPLDHWTDPGYMGHGFHRRI